MHTEILPKIIENIDLTIEHKPNDRPLFSKQGYETEIINKGNFNEINTEEANNSNEENQKLAFIDGGNIELLKSVNFSVQFIRVYGCIIKNNKRIYSEKREFYILIKTKQDSTNKDTNQINYEIEFFGDENTEHPEKNDLIFDSMDKTIQQGTHRAEISKLGDVARTFAELQLAANLTKSLEENDIMILDGDLEAKYTHQEKYLSALYEKAKNNNIIITALSKTCTLLTESGNSVIGLLNSLGPEHPWYYKIAKTETEKHKADILITKLNKNSKYAFKFEIHNKENKISNNNNTNQILSLLQNNSNDSVFPGYPYGLIITDRFARVQKQEAEYLTTMLMANAKDKWKKILKYINTMNAHSILDNIS